MWNLIIIPWLCRFDTFIVVKDYFIKRETLGVLFFNGPLFCRKRGTLGVLIFNVPQFLKLPWEMSRPLLKSKIGKTGV